MRLTPRKEEVAAVVSVLENTSFDSADAMAKALIKRVADLLEEREWYALAWRSSLDAHALSLAWGIFPSENEAEKFAKGLSIGGTGRPVKLYSAVEMAGKSAKDDAAELGRGLCANCGHPHGTHQHEKRGGICQIDGCGCKTLTKG